MKTSTLLSDWLRPPARGAMALLLALAAPLACDDEANVVSATGAAEPSEGEGEPGDNPEPSNPPGDGQTGANGGSGNEGTGGSNSLASGGSGNAPSSAGASSGGSGSTDPAPQCLTFDNAERVPLYDGTTLPPLN